MKILFVWITATILCLTITTAWYVGNFMVVSIAHSFATLITGGQGGQLVGLIEFMMSIWGPLFDLMVLVWALVSSGRVTTESQTY
jgi:hypothetical protein